MEASSYKTILKPTGEVCYKDRNSKFFGRAFPLQGEAEVNHFLDEIKGIHPKANHLCYAWQIGVRQPDFRAHDDGEPTYSAGMPIYGQIQSFGLTNVLVTVRRVYGGTKLGVGGLVKAYRETGKMALETAEVIVKIIKKEVVVTCDYTQLNRLHKLIKQNHIEVLGQQLSQNCTLQLAIALDNAESIIVLLKNTPGLTVSPEEPGTMIR